MLLAAIAMGCSLLSYNVQEMGWGFLNPKDSGIASDTPCTNWLSIPGLYIAGLLYFLFGATAIYLCILVAVYGIYRLILPKYDPTWQLVAMGAMVLLGSAILALQSVILWQWAGSLSIYTPGGWLGNVYATLVEWIHLNPVLALILLTIGHGVALVIFVRISPHLLAACFWSDTKAMVTGLSHLCSRVVGRRSGNPSRRQGDPYLDDEDPNVWKQQPLGNMEYDRPPLRHQDTERPLPPHEQAHPLPQRRPSEARLQQPAIATPAEVREEENRRQAPLPPRQIPRRPSVVQELQHRPMPMEQEDEPLPPPLSEQLDRAKRQDAMRIPTQLPPTGRGRQPATMQRDRSNLLDLMRPVEEEIERRNSPGYEDEQDDIPINAHLQAAMDRHMEQTSGAPARPVAAGSRPLAPARSRMTPTAVPPSTPPADERASAPVTTTSAREMRAKVQLPTPRELPTEDPREQHEDYPLPPYELLAYRPIPPEVGKAAREEMESMQQRILETLETFKISATPGPITRGPSITRYEFYPPRGLRVNRITALNNDLMLATSAKSVNILAPIPGKNTVGIELENATKAPVFLRELLQDPLFRDPSLRIPVALGKDVYGNSVIGDLAAMPHTLVAGTTGSGKSVCINSMILSMLYKFRPDELKLILVDPKVVEMQPYKKLPHLICPVVTNPGRVIGALRWAVNEMEHRYKLFSKIGVRNFEDFNNRPPDFEPEPEEEESEQKPPVNFDVEAWASEIERQADEEIPLGEETQEELDFEADERIPSRLPYIVIIIDELADLMMVVKEDLENYVARLTQKARAAGIHLVVATQTPRSNVVTGIIKANIPCRIALKVSSPLDSRIILDTSGAENLLGRGDFLFLPPGGISKLTRAQGAFVSDAEIASIVKFCASHAKQKFEQGVTAEMDNSDGEAPYADNGGRLSGSRSSGDEEDELYTRCVNLVVTERKASTSLLQRRFSIGYGRAAKIMDLMEERGIISPPQGATRAREVLIDEA